MATTTPNFGWAVPTSTDLVKDGAVAIETLGDSIDASLVDLKGGTTGQVLAKASNTDMDFSWVAQDDSNAIQNSIVDAKGDIIAATADNTPARLAVGANNTVLTADSSTATGLKWAAASSGTFPVMRSANIASTFTTTSASMTDQTGYTLTFTPVSATNKITISVDFQYFVNTTGANVEWQIVRGATVIFYRAQAIAASGQYQNMHFEVTDTNVAASSQTYKLQVAINGGFTYTNYNDTVGFTGSQIRSLEVY